MAKKDIILGFLSRTKSCFCDDCLAEILKIFPRQQVNQICNELFKQRQITRRKGLCSKCRRKKIANSYSIKVFGDKKKLVCSLCGSSENLIVKTLLKNVQVQLPLIVRGKSYVADMRHMYLDRIGKGSKWDVTWETVECSKCDAELFEINSEKDLAWPKKEAKQEEDSVWVKLVVPAGVIKAPIRNGAVVSEEAVLMLFIGNQHSAPGASL